MKNKIKGSVQNSLEGVGELYFLFIDTIRFGFKRPYEFQSLLVQMEELGVKSLLIVVVSCFFVGTLRPFGVKTLSICPRTISNISARTAAGTAPASISL